MQKKLQKPYPIDSNLMIAQFKSNENTDTMIKDVSFAKLFHGMRLIF